MPPRPSHAAQAAKDSPSRDTIAAQAAGMTSNGTFLDVTRSGVRMLGPQEIGDLVGLLSLFLER